MKTFEYYVNGTTFEDTEAFGKAWKSAVKMAKAEHCAITRAVINGNEVRHEFYAKGGCFLNERYFDILQIKIF